MVKNIRKRVKDRLKVANSQESTAVMEGQNDGKGSEQALSQILLVSDCTSNCF